MGRVHISGRENMRTCGCFYVYKLEGEVGSLCVFAKGAEVGIAVWVRRKFGS